MLNFTLLRLKNNIIIWYLGCQVLGKMKVFRDTQLFLKCQLRLFPRNSLFSYLKLGFILKYNDIDFPVFIFGYEILR